GGLIEYSICFGVRCITKKETFITSTLKLTEPFLLIDEAFATKDSKVGYIWFLPGDELIWSFLEESVGIHSVGCMTRRIDCFRPKLLGRAIVIQHCSCESDECLVF